MPKKRGVEAVLGGLLVLALASMSMVPRAAEMTTIGGADVQVDVCQVDLATDDVRMFWSAPDGALYGGFEGVQAALQSEQQHLLCATNGGIYGKDLHPIGLYVEAGQVLRRLNTRRDGFGNFYLQPNGVFLVTQHGAAILTTDEVAAQWDGLAASVRYATQSGPLLLRAGVINSVFTPGSGNRVVRNAACVKSKTEMLLGKSRSAINFYDFASVLRDAGCTDALYLDGSISTLYPVDALGAQQKKFSVIIGVVAPQK